MRLNSLFLQKAALTCLALPVALAMSVRETRADDIYTVIVKKQEEKSKTRWNLSDWLETRDKMRLMDLWLALHSSSPYEFFFSGEYRFKANNSATPTPLDSWQLSAGAYASIVGLEAEHLFSQQSESSLLLSLRVFGFHAQGTQITLQGGLLAANDPTASRNGVLGMKTSLYLTKYAGIEGRFRHIFASTPNNAGSDREGNRFALGAFIDFRYLRLFGEYFGGPTQSYPNGLASGFKFFF